METAVRHPRILDPVIVFDGERGTIVLLRAGYAHIDADDDLRVVTPTDALRWVADREVWVIVRSDPPEPTWLHEDPDFADAAPGEIVEAWGK
jgi:hypothetical protein